MAKWSSSVAGPSSGLAALRAAISSKTRPVERETTREIYMASRGFKPLRPKSLPEIDKFIAADRALWAGVIKSLNISLD